MTISIDKNQYVLIIGAMKCGTSSLFRYLEGHPEICLSAVKEPEFFSKFSGWENGSKEYNELWPEFDGSKHKYAIEASTGYTKFTADPDVARRIHEYGLRPKFIYIVREPFARITSHFNFISSATTVPLTITDSHFIDTTKYYSQLEPYRAYFPVEDFLILDFEELKSDPARLLRRVYAFLGIDSGYFPESYKVVNALQLESDLERKLRTSQIRSVFKLVPRPLKNFGKRLLRRSDPPSKRILTEDERALIMGELQEDMLKFSETYGFDVSKWGFKSQS